MSQTGVTVREPWPDARREETGLQFAMWVFLATEVLFFGALICTYAVNRWAHPAAVREAGRHAAFAYGLANTVILTLSGLSMAIADRAVKEQLGALAKACLWITLALGTAFVVIKALEYYKDISDNLWPGPDFALRGAGARPFWSFYWVATGVHAIHLTIGLGVVARLLVFAHRGSLVRRVPSMTISTLYWEFVDIVWLFLFALIYLVGRT
ncbi:MAG TPA: cytochrome c oxidase subunit 3 [Caulobacteraceae bacterium]|nr:cytochrome c oxidase subunit 3 [Caulobacteraceae bacterium]